MTQSNRNNIFSKSNLGTTSIWLALFLTVGYPISVAIPILFHLPSGAINISFRIVYVFFSIYLIIGSLIKPESKYISLGGLFILLFWALYSSRLVYDISFKGIIFDSPFYVYSFAFGNCLLPSIALLLAGKYIDLNQLKSDILKFLILVNIVTLVLLIYSSGGLSLESLTQRMMITDTDDESKLMLNGIIISQTGAFLGVVSFARLLFDKEKKRVLFIISFLLGLFNLMIGASRGPMLTFLFCVFLILFVFLLQLRRTYLNFIRILAAISALIILYVSVVSSFLESANISIFMRLLDMFQGGESASLDVRPLLFKSAWNQFLANPILGDQYLSRYANFYPHNIYLEVLMALGLIGAFIFLGILIFSIRKTAPLLKGYNENIFIPFLVLLTILFAGMTSGSLFTGVGLWAWLSLFNSLTLNKDYVITNRIIRL